jgi:hypothetical protein
MLVRRLLELQQEISAGGAGPSEPRDRPAERWRGRLARFALITAISVVGAAGPSAAEPRPWNGTLSFEMGALEPFVFTGSGVATVNRSSGGGQLSTLRLAGGITGSGTVPVTDPDATLPGIYTVGFSSVRLTASLGTGTFVKDQPESVDLISGVTGYTLPDYNFNAWTRAIEVTVLGATDREVTSMTLRTLDTSGGAFVVASIFTSGGALVAEGATTVGAGNQPPITIPISATLTAGATYYFAFFSSTGVADVFVPDSQPYVETSGTFTVNGAYYVPDYAFPTFPTSVFPMIEVEVAPNPRTDSAIIPVRGLLRMCRMDMPPQPVCQAVGLTRSAGSIGVGVGGTVGNQTFLHYPPAKISIEAAPWTLGTGTAVNQTVGSGFTTLTRTGFVHDPASGTASTAQTSGVIQLVTPMQIVTENYPPGYERIAMFGKLTIHFIPEPGRLLLLGSGVVGLALIGGRRMRM